MDHPKVDLPVIKVFIGTYEYFIVEKQEQLVWLKSPIMAARLWLYSC